MGAGSMNITSENKTNAHVAVFEFEGRPAAPIKREVKISVPGKIAIAIVLFWVAMCFVGPLVAPYREADIVADQTFAPAGESCSPFRKGVCSFHLLGTDYLGRDVFSRVLYGSRTTMGISVAATLLAYVIGVTFGITAAIRGPKLDMVLSRINDVFISIPSIMLGLVVIAAVGTSIPILIVTAGAIYSTTVFRLSRAFAMDVMVTDFVEAARARGEGLWWMLYREILPNIVMPLATDCGIRLIYIVLFIASLSFLGLGVQPPVADWGGLVRENIQGIAYASWAPIAPALAISSLTISINLIVDEMSAKSGGKLAKSLLK